MASSYDVRRTEGIGKYPGEGGNNERLAKVLTKQRETEARSPQWPPRIPGQAWVIAAPLAGFSQQQCRSQGDPLSLDKEHLIVYPHAKISCIPEKLSDEGEPSAAMKLDSTVASLPREFREKMREQEAMLTFAHIIVRDAAGRITFWSRTDEEIYGWTAEEAIGADIFKLLRSEIPESRDVLESFAIRSGRWEGEIIHVGRDGRRHTVMTTWTPHYEESGEFAAFVEVNCDISRQKNAERELRARERDFRTFFELNGVGNVIADVNTGRFLTVNQTFCDITGYAAEELAHLSGPDLTHPADRARDAEGWDRSLEQGDAHYMIEKRYLQRDGAVIWVSVTSSMIRDEAGTPLYAAGVVIDVTPRHDALNEIGNARIDLERRVAERTAALGAVNAELDQVSKKFETLIDASPAAIIALDPANRIVIWNPEAEQLFGLREEDVLGRRLPELPLEWNFSDTLESLLQAEKDARASLSVRLSQGRLLDLGIWSAPYPGLDGSPDGHVLLLLDETEKKFLEHALLDAGEREQRRIGQELHDHLAQQLLGAAFGAQALFKELERAGSASAARAGELARLINDSVLDARNMARGINPIEIDSAGLMSALQELAERTHSGDRIELHCDAAAPVHRPETALHVFRIAQEAVNNALRHSQATRILIRLSAEGSNATLEVSDNGTGMPDSLPANPGVGIGIMKYRAQAIRGELSIEAALEGGTTVTCTFPNHA